LQLLALAVIPGVLEDLIFDERVNLPVL